MTEQRSTFVFLGRQIGTYAGWDGDESCFVLYEFQPIKGLQTIPTGDLEVDWAKGLFAHYTDNGELTWSSDIITLMRDLPIDHSAQLGMERP